MKIIYGRKPILEAVKSGVNIEKIYIGFNQHGNVLNQIKTLAHSKGINVTQVPLQKIIELSGSKNSQGIAAIKLVSKLITFENLIKDLEGTAKPLLLILDTIQDPHNLGAILRTAESAGVDGIIITMHKSAPLNETVEKVSAGAVSHVKICEVKNLSNVLKELKLKGFWIMGSSLSDVGKLYNEIDYNLPVALILGNEEKGMRRLTEENCDFLIKIPMKGKLQSLNVSVAAGILLFEIVRQRTS